MTQPTHPGSEFAFTDYTNLRPDTGSALDEPLTLGAGDTDDGPAGNLGSTNYPGPGTGPVPYTSEGAPAYPHVDPAAPGAYTPGAEDAPVGSLAEELSATFSTFTVPTCTVPIPGRRGWALKFRLDWTERQAQERRRAAADPSSPDGLSAERIFRATIAEQCVQILRRNPDTGVLEPVMVNGRSVAFRDPALWPLLRHPATGVRPRSAKEAVNCLLPIFTMLSQVGLEVSRAAGDEGLADPLDLD